MRGQVGYQWKLRVERKRVPVCHMLLFFDDVESPHMSSMHNTPHAHREESAPLARQRYDSIDIKSLNTLAPV